MVELRGQEEANDEKQVIALGDLVSEALLEALVASRVGRGN